MTFFVEMDPSFTCAGDRASKDCAVRFGRPMVTVDAHVKSIYLDTPPALPVITGDLMAHPVLRRGASRLRAACLLLLSHAPPSVPFPVDNSPQQLTVNFNCRRNHSMEIIISIPVMPQGML